MVFSFGRPFEAFSIFAYERRVAERESSFGHTKGWYLVVGGECVDFGSIAKFAGSLYLQAGRRLIFGCPSLTVCACQGYSTLERGLFQGIIAQSDKHTAYVQTSVEVI